MKFQTQLQTHFSKCARPCFVIAATFIFGLCAHAYRLVNPIFSFDSLLIYGRPDLLHQVSLGRFSQMLYWELRGDLAAPFLLGLLALIWLALANYTVVSALEIRSARHIVILCGILSTNAVLTFSFASYLPWTDIYMLAYFLAALAAWLAIRFSYGFLAAWIPLVLSLGFYQSYMSVAVILLMIAVMKHILDGMEGKALLVRIAKYLAALLGGAILYAVVLRLVLAGTGVELSTGYNGLSQVGNYAQTDILKLITDTMAYPFQYMFHPETYHSRLAGWINLAVFLSALFGLVRVAAAKKITKVPLVLLILCVAAMPFGINAVYFVSKRMLHSLMIFSFFFFYAAVIVIWEYCGELPLPQAAQRAPAAAAGVKKLLTVLCSGSLLLLVLFHVVFANQIYLRKGLEYDATISFAAKVTYMIEQTDGYVPGETPVVFYGSFEASPLFAAREGFENLTGVGMLGQFALSHSANYFDFFNAILSYNINLYTDPGANDLKLLPEVQAMPAFPAKESCRIIDGVLIVKFVQPGPES